MVGFALYGIDEDDHEYWIYRMMIDQKHQGKGYGVKAVNLIIEDIRNIKEEHHQTITLSYEPTNEHAKRIYEKSSGIDHCRRTGLPLHILILRSRAREVSS
ncbi:GNAT family N-acetyltransferase [Ureibacillus sp. GCM10028918]|uniref:GNAT family N-acetyltransferase n=1 Tax=Ureibacillus sp. GCM10028918 TaxID=3273429 RepID=UPI0036186797